jgi:two-component system CheB/CheR fusion protein
VADEADDWTTPDSHRGPVDRSADIPVVGLGGSAGALTSFEVFFAAMPANSDAAFVIVQHKLPDHESLLPQILAKHTRMLVVQATDGMKIEANCIYATPPGHRLSLSNGVLHFTEPAKETDTPMSIDFFFRSLAEDRAEKAICILFSGAGSDGTQGAHAVRGAGGLVLAQDPETAQFRNMPGNAIAAGAVDHVLPPDRMPEAILEYLRHPYIDSKRQAELLDALAKPGDIQDILALVLARTGCDFRLYKKSTVLRRIGRRMGIRHLVNLAEYNSLLHRDADEVKHLLKDLLIKVTAFFRNPEAFDELLVKAIAPLVEAKSSDEHLRIWVPGCASGEEAYSIAILVTEQLAMAGKDCSLQLFATDVDEQALELARRGVYPESIAADVGSERLQKFFTLTNQGYQVNDSLRKSMIFAAQNLLANPPFSKMDLISCRNLLIYLDTDAQTKLMALFNFALKPGGYLFLGRSEMVVGQSDLFETASPKGRLYRRLASTRLFVLDSPIFQGRGRVAPAAAAPGKPSGSNFADVLRLEILRHFDASVVLIDRHGQILQFHGQTDKYLNLPAAGPAFNVLNLARGRLPAKLRTAIHQAILEGTTVILESVPIMREESTLFARVTVAPVPHKGEGEPLLVVFFEDVQPPPAKEVALLQPEENETLVKRLEDELRVTRQDLQTTIVELQSANEDLRAANEEINSANEELQLTNEEMISSTEELQSTNEELTTVNNQLQEKIALLDAANTDMANLLKSSQVASLFLDRELRVKFFTPATARILKMIHSDMGRPLSSLATDLIGHDLTADALEVVRNDSEVETEIQHSCGSSYLVHLMPYYTQEGRSDGVIATFSDITRLRRAEKHLAAIVESSSDAIFSKTADGIILMWNRAAERMYGYSAAESVGKNVSMLIPAERAHEAKEIMKKIRRGELIAFFETERVTKDGRKLHVSLSVSPMKDASGRIIGASTIARDISAHKRAEEALKQSEERFRALVESSPNALLLTAADGTITLLNRQAETMFGYERRELAGKLVEILVPKRFRNQHASHRAEFAAAPKQRPMGAGRDLFAVRKDGSEFPVEIGLTPLDMPDGPLTLATITDITERKRLEKGA